MEVLFIAHGKSNSKVSVWVTDTYVICVEFNLHCQEQQAAVLLFRLRGIYLAKKWLLDGTLFLRLLPCMNFESAALGPASFLI